MGNGTSYQLGNRNHHRILSEIHNSSSKTNIKRQESVFYLALKDI